MEDEITLAKLRTIVDSMVDAVIMANDKGIIEFFNPAATRLFGYTPEEAIGQNLKILMPEPNRSHHDGYLERYNRTHKKHIIGIGREEMAQRKNGELFPVMLTISECKVDEKSFFTGVVRDITRTREAETQVQELQKLEASANIAGSIAHDFKNILAPILGFAQLALDNEMPDEIREYLQKIEESGHHAKQLIEKILTFGKNNQDNPPVEIQTKSAFDTAIALLKTNCPANIQLNVKLDQDLPPIMMQEGQLEQVLLNLGNNAFHAMEKTGGVLEIQVKREPTKLLFSVQDTGCGMDPETLSKIFEPYFTTKEKNVGTGLGLFVIQKIISDRGGKIEVTSELDKGSRFEFTLPVAPKE